jgi:hypothetical protein
VKISRTNIAIIVCLMAFCCCAAPAKFEFTVQIPYFLFAGWIHYLIRVVPQVRPDPSTVATAIGCFVVIVLGFHWFARWLYSARMQDGQPQWSWRWTFRIVAVVVLMFAVGVASVGIVHQTGWLITSEEPIIRNRREAVPRIYSQQNLKQHGLAIHNFADMHNGQLPVLAFTPDGRPLHSWQTAILPFIEQEDLFKAIEKDKPWDHPANRSAIEVELKVFLHPGEKNTKAANGLPATHYAANVLALGGDRPRKLMDFPEGTANTILVGEAVRNPRSWADPLGGRNPKLGLNHPQGFGGPSKQQKTQFLMADGSVRTFTPIELEELIN